MFHLTSSHPVVEQAADLRAVTWPWPPARTSAGILGDLDPTSGRIAAP